MNDENYTKYSLSRLEEFVHDSICCSDAKPEEIYEVIKKAVLDNYYTFKDKTSKAYELLCLLNGNDLEKYSTFISCDSEDTSEECKNAWGEFWEQNYYPEESTESEENAKNKKWILPVDIDAVSGEYYFSLPDELLEQANLVEGDEIYWVDNKDGTYTIRKSIKTLGMDDC